MPLMNTRSLVAIAVVALSAASVHAQMPASFELRGPGGRRPITAQDFARFQRREVTASVNNVSGRFSGVMLADLLAMVGASAGDALQAPALASYVLVEGADGYRVLFSLAEANSSFAEKVVLLVDRKDGAPLAPSDGPFQLIVPDERRPARWVRNVTRISVVRVP
jgi:hypothetical protein